MFLAGCVGGPSLLLQNLGRAGLGGRLVPFAMGLQAGEKWVAGRVLAMEDVGIDEAVRAKLLENFFHTADFMRNKEG